VNVLLDTHVFLWSITSRQLSPAANVAFLDPGNILWLSVASYWEICIKLSLGKLVLPENWVQVSEMAMAVNGIRWLAIEPGHCREVLALPHHHRDPFDRLLVAQARLEGLTLLSADPNLGRYDVPVIW